MYSPRGGVSYKRSTPVGLVLGGWPALGAMRALIREQPMCTCFTWLLLLLSLLLSGLELGDAQVYEPYIRALLGTAAHFC